MNILDGVLLLVSLQFRFGDRDLWRVQVRSTNDHDCAVQVLEKQKNPRKITVEECRRLRALGPQAEAELRAAPTALASQGKNYVLSVGERRANVVMKAPEECELTPLGESNCKKNKLSKSQELLLKLLPYAPSQWMD